MVYNLSGLWKNKNSSGIFLFKQKENKRDVLIFGIGVGEDKFSNIGKAVIQNDSIIFSWYDSYVSEDYSDNAVMHICESKIISNEKLRFIREIVSDKNAKIKFDYGNFERIFDEEALNKLIALQNNCYKQILDINTGDMIK